MLTNIHYKTASDFITLLLRRSDHADHQGAKGAKVKPSHSPTPDFRDEMEMCVI